MSIQSISRNDTDFPSKLTRLHIVPKQIYLFGNQTILGGPIIGIVGSRKVSPYGIRVTSDLAAAAAKQGVTVVSGLALGVDSVSHKAVIDAKGKTIAVLPSGIEKIYPASHRGLAKSIIGCGGLLLSEYTGKDLPMKHQFIERNRIIAALSDALLITEAAENSGSLHTARFALELGKPVLAVPGNINSATSAGTNNLLKMGAFPVTSAEDIFNVLGIEKSKNPEKSKIYGDNEFETEILKLLADGMSKGSDLLENSPMPAEDFQRHLTMLEIKGRISPLGNDNWSLT